MSQRHGASAGCLAPALCPYPPFNTPSNTMRWELFPEAHFPDEETKAHEVKEMRWGHCAGTQAATIWSPCLTAAAVDVLCPSNSAVLCTRSNPSLSLLGDGPWGLIRLCCGKVTHPCRWLEGPASREPVTVPPTPLLLLGEQAESLWLLSSPGAWLEHPILSDSVWS